jgi:hypothetical protein
MNAIRLKEHHKELMKQSWVYANINKIDKALAKPIKRKREKTEINSQKSKQDIISANKGDSLCSFLYLK